MKHLNSEETMKLYENTMSSWWTKYNELVLDTTAIFVYAIVSIGFYCHNMIKNNK